VTERTNEDWLRDLQAEDNAEALEDLRDVIIRGLRAALSTQVRGDLETVVEDFTQEALIRIIKNLDTFRGESRFLTWAQKIAINVAFTELRRRHWQNVSLQDVIEGQDSLDFTPSFLTDPAASPEEQTTQQDILDAVMRLVKDELTERQRDAIVSVVFGGMPLEEVARRMDTNRNALYKLIHDARQRLKKKLIEHTGLTPQEVMAIFAE
jgi:RNA polymerase sigma-70 factor (ECF subfamily)